MDGCMWLLFRRMSDDKWIKFTDILTEESSSSSSSSRSSSGGGSGRKSEGFASIHWESLREKKKRLGNLVIFRVTYV
jgi:hypothetical protein